MLFPLSYTFTLSLLVTMMMLVGRRKEQFGWETGTDGMMMAICYICGGGGGGRSGGKG